MTDDLAFVSYAREDSDFALRLAAALKQRGASVWLDQLDIVAGARWDRAVEEALARSKTMLVVLSPASVASANVLDEVGYGLDEQKSLIPILYRDCTIPLRLRRFQYVDFRSDFERALQSLAKALGDTAAADVQPAAARAAQPMPDRPSPEVQSALPRETPAPDSRPPATSPAMPRPESASDESRVPDTASPARSRAVWIAGAAVLVLVILIVALQSRRDSVGAPEPEAAAPAPSTQSPAPSVPPDASAQPSPEGTSPPIEPIRAAAPPGDAVVVDSQRGLMWTALDNGADVAWPTADGYCAALTLGGYSDWRLPTTDEASSVYDPNNLTGHERYPSGASLPIHAASGFRIAHAAIWTAKRSDDAAGFVRLTDGESFRVRGAGLNDMRLAAVCVRSGS